ncbi:MAG: hypothetical protein R3292_13740 [Alcanivorax sp.]|nr:hypothetical protein [Alcanivorax sp.]
MAGTMIDRKHYPELDLIMWDHAGRFIAPEKAFALYETRWRFVDQTRLENTEKHLIAQLKEKHGHGVMLAAC